MADVQFGAQVSAYLTSWDDIRAVAQAMDGGRYDSIWFADHFVPAQPGQGGRGPRGLRGVLTGRSGRGCHRDAAHRASGAGQHLSQSRPRGQDRRVGRPHFPRTLHPRHRRILVPARAPGLRLGFPTDERASGSLRGSLQDAAQHHPQRRRQRHIQRTILLVGRRPAVTGKLQQSDSDPGRRHRPEANVENARHVRRHPESRRLGWTRNVRRATEREGRHPSRPLRGCRQGSVGNQDHSADALPAHGRRGSSERVWKNVSARAR